MSVYFVKGKGWRYDFTLKGERRTGTWFRTKAEAREAEVEARKELRKTTSTPVQEMKPTDMGFLELVNRRLDYVKAYNCDRYYTDYRYSARRWVERWGHLDCGEIPADDVQDFVLERKRVSTVTANKEIRLLRATFNFGVKRGWTEANPTRTIAFLPVEKRIKYVPPPADIQAVIEAASPDDRDYLWTIHETMARVGEVNRLSWNDVDLERRTVILYTRKKKGGHRTPRKVPMTGRLFEILSRRYAEHDRGKPWVFWRKSWSREMGCMVAGPYQDRKALMKTLCAKAGVRYFRFHALRHAGASILEQCNVPIGTIQRILGHENRTTTEIYLHSIGDSERHAMEIFERAALAPRNGTGLRPSKPSQKQKVSHKSHTATRLSSSVIPVSC